MDARFVQYLNTGGIDEEMFINLPPLCQIQVLEIYQGGSLLWLLSFTHTTALNYNTLELEELKVRAPASAYPAGEKNMFVVWTFLYC